MMKVQKHYWHTYAPGWGYFRRTCCRCGREAKRRIHPGVAMNEYEWFYPSVECEEFEYEPLPKKSWWARFDNWFRMLGEHEGHGKGFIERWRDSQKI